MYTILVDGMIESTAHTLESARYIFDVVRWERDATQLIEIEDRYGNRVAMARGSA